MALKESEAIVLRTYPMRESDLLVTLFTRLEGKVRGVARAAKKSKRRFGGALEPLTYVRAIYDERERQELVRLDSCEVIESPMATEVGYSRAVALGHVAELLEELLPDREASDAVFRLTLSVLRELRGTTLWMPLTYFQLWMTRLMASCRNCPSAWSADDRLRESGPFITLWRTALFVGTISVWRRRKSRRSRAKLQPRCCAQEFPILRRSIGRKLWPPTFESFSFRFWNGISRRSW